MGASQFYFLFIYWGFGGGGGIGPNIIEHEWKNIS